MSDTTSRLDELLLERSLTDPELLAAADVIGHGLTIWQGTSAGHVTAAVGQRLTRSM
jgi:hypothetical protein